MAASPAGRRAEERFFPVEPAPTFGERPPERAGFAEAEGSDLLRLPLERLVIVENYRVERGKGRRIAVEGDPEQGPKAEVPGAIVGEVDPSVCATTIQGGEWRLAKAGETAGAGKPGGQRGSGRRAGGVSASDVS